MPSSTAKRVLLYRFDRQPLEAIVNPANYLQDASIELITVSGALQSVPYADVKALCFATEPGRPDLFTQHNLFERRPKLPGLWARFSYRDGDRLDGLLSHNLLDWPTLGYLLTPPKAGLTRQRVFIPRQVVATTELLGVIGITSPGISRRRSESAVSTSQLTIFEN